MKMAEAANISVPESVKKLVRAVLLSKIGGVPIKRFQKDYQALIGENFPLLSLGFNSLLPCMKSMPDVVRIIGDNSDTCTLLGVGDDSSFMSGPAIMAQFPVDGKQQNRHRRRRQNGASKKEHVNKNQNEQNFVVKPPSEKHSGLVANLQGLYAVVVKGIHNEYTANEVYRLFSMEGEIVGKSEFNSFYFYRFANVSPVERILSKYDGIMVNGTRIGVAPAQEKKGAKKTKSESVSSSSNSRRFDEQSQNRSTSINGPAEVRSLFSEPAVVPSVFSGPAVVPNVFSGPVVVPSLFSGNHISEPVRSEQVRSEGTSHRIGEKSQNGYRTNRKENEDGKKMDRNNDKRMNTNMDESGDKRNSHRKKNYTDGKQSGKQQQRDTNMTTDNRRNYVKHHLPFENEKRLHSQLEAIDDTLLPRLPQYRIHLDNINKSMTEAELLKHFENFNPMSCHLGKASKLRKFIHADMSFRNLDDIKAIAEYLQHNCIMGERIISHLSFQTIIQLGLDHHAMGITAVTPGTIPSSRLTNGQDWNEKDNSTFRDSRNGQRSTTPAHSKETGCRSSSNCHSPGINMESMLKALPESVTHGASHASDSEGSTTGGPRRRRPCILDILEDNDKF